MLSKFGVDVHDPCNSKFLHMDFDIQNKRHYRECTTRRFNKVHIFISVE